MGAAWLVVLAEAREGTAVPLAEPDVALASATDVAGDATEPAWTADAWRLKRPRRRTPVDEAGAPQAVTAQDRRDGRREEPGA